MKKRIGILLAVCIMALLCIYGYEDIKFEYILNKAEYYAENGEHKNALEEYDKLLEIQPEMYELYFNKAVILGEQGKIEEAYNTFLEAEKINNTDPDLYYNIAHLYQDVDEEQYQKYLEKGMLVEFEQGVLEE